MSDTPKTYDFSSLSHAFELFAASPAARDRGNEGNPTRMLAKALYSHADMAALPKAIESLQRAAQIHGVPEELVANTSYHNDNENLSPCPLTPWPAKLPMGCILGATLPLLSNHGGFASARPQSALE